jgi:hypothetical protein
MVFIFVHKCLDSYPIGHKYYNYIHTTSIYLICKRYSVNADMSSLALFGVQRFQLQKPDLRCLAVPHTNSRPFSAGGSAFRGIKQVKSSHSPVDSPYSPVIHGCCCKRMLTLKGAYGANHRAGQLGETDSEKEKLKGGLRS